MKKKVLMIGILIAVVLLGAGGFMAKEWVSNREGSVPPPLQGWLFKVDRNSSADAYFVARLFSFEGLPYVEILTENQVKQITQLADIRPVTKQAKSSSVQIREIVANFIENDSLAIGNPIVAYTEIDGKIRPWRWTTPVYNNKGESYKLYNIFDGELEVTSYGSFSDYQKEIFDENQNKNVLMHWIQAKQEEGEITEGYYVLYRVRNLDALRAILR